MGCIYALCDPDTMQIYYVGKTIRKKARPFASYGVAVTAWRKALVQQGKKPLVKILDADVVTDKLNIREGFWIAKLRRLKHPLFNIKRGGARARYIGQVSTVLPLDIFDAFELERAHQSRDRRVSLINSGFLREIIELYLHERGHQMATDTIYLRVEPEVKARLQREADESGRKLQEVANDAFQRYIKLLDRKPKKPSQSS
jgi:hypothetical protein